MMSAQRDWGRRLPALTYPAISAETAAPCLAARRPAPSVSRAGYRDLTAILLAFLRGYDFWLCTGRRFAAQITLVVCGFTLRAV
jgi:hypothetical protein